MQKIVVRAWMASAILLLGPLLLNVEAAMSIQPGDLDPTFGQGGKVIDPPGVIYSVAIQPDEKIVTLGDNGQSFVITRYNPNGSPDTSFGSGGKVTIVFGGALIILTLR
jgi:uncharacterized delta-60 repeat protein